MAAGIANPGRHQRILSVAVLCAIALHLATVLALRPTPGRAGHGDAPARVMVTRLIAPPSPGIEKASPEPVDALAAPGLAAPDSRSVMETATAAQAPRPVAVSVQAPQVAASAIAITVASTLAASSGSAVDQGPHPLADIVPETPPTAGPRSGSVTLHLVISERGDVEKISVVSATPPGLFDEAALAAFGRARYAPALRGGLPVRSDVTYQVDFAPLATGADTSSRTY